MPTEIIILSMLRALIEVSGLMLLLRGAMWLLGPKARTGNFLYDMITIASMPFLRLTRYIMPRAVRDPFIPTVTFLLVFALWLGLALGQQALCVQRAVQC